VTVLAVIPARLAAVRLPRKPMRDLAGAPLIVRVWERVKAMRVADEIVVATESEDVAALVREAGGRAVLTSPAHLSGTERVAEVAARAEFRDHSVVVNVQGDEPFLEAAAVRGAVDAVRGGRPIGTAASPAGPEILDQPAAVKVVIADDGRALYFSRAPIPFLRDHADRAHRDPLVRLHLGVYAFTPRALADWVALPPHPLELAERLEQLRPLAHGTAIGVAVVTPAPPMGGIDTEDDLRRAQDIFRSNGAIHT
jgi:3-deoxy-manno-octulosonate cytidylyltransferase (CMP-KDO synthetase)